MGVKLDKVELLEENVLLLRGGGGGGNWSVGMVWEDEKVVEGLISDGGLYGEGFTKFGFDSFIRVDGLISGGGV